MTDKEKITEYDPERYKLLTRKEISLELAVSLITPNLNTRLNDVYDILQKEIYDTHVERRKLANLLGFEV